MTGQDALSSRTHRGVVTLSLDTPVRFTCKILSTYRSTRYKLTMSRHGMDEAYLVVVYNLFSFLGGALFGQIYILFLEDVPLPLQSWVK